MLLPAVAGFVCVSITRKLGVMDLSALRLPALIPPLVFIFSVALSLAVPVFYRSFFAHRKRSLLCISQEELYKVEGSLIRWVMVTPYLALVAYGLNFPRFHQCATILMGLYAIYYFYPSEKRMALQKKIYRVS